jgi:hypothetical protein
LPRFPSLSPSEKSEALIGPPLFTDGCEKADFMNLHLAGGAGRGVDEDAEGLQFHGVVDDHNVPAEFGEGAGTVE